MASCPGISDGDHHADDRPASARRMKARAQWMPRALRCAATACLSATSRTTASTSIPIPASRRPSRSALAAAILMPRNALRGNRSLETLMIGPPGQPACRRCRARHGTQPRRGRQHARRHPRRSAEGPLHRPPLRRLRRHRRRLPAERRPAAAGAPFRLRRRHRHAHPPHRRRRHQARVP